MRFFKKAKSQTNFLALKREIKSSPGTIFYLQKRQTLITNCLNWLREFCGLSTILYESFSVLDFSIISEYIGEVAERFKKAVSRLLLHSGVDGDDVKKQRRTV